MSLFQEAWSVGIMINHKGEYQLLCSGSILSRYFIVTAAHCEKQARNRLGGDFANITLVMGMSDPSEGDELIKRKRGIKRKVVRFLPHEQYDNVTAYFDIALIEVDESIPFTENIWPICLGKQSITDIDGHIGDKPLAVVGYGPLRSDVKVLDNPKPLLRDLKVTGFKVRTCQNKYSSVSTDDSRYKAIEESLPQKFENPSIFCAGIEGSNAGTCSGDSGGPIQWYNQDNQQTFLQGVVHGSPVSCDGERFPAIFINVAHYDILKWIYSEVFPETIVEKPKNTYIGKTPLNLINHVLSFLFICCFFDT